MPPVCALLVRVSPHHYMDMLSAVAAATGDAFHFAAEVTAPRYGAPASRGEGAARAASGGGGEGSAGGGGGTLTRTGTPNSPGRSAVGTPASALRGSRGAAPATGGLGGSGAQRERPRTVTIVEVRGARASGARCGDEAPARVRATTSARCDRGSRRNHRAPLLPWVAVAVVAVVRTARQSTRVLCDWRRGSDGCDVRVTVQRAVLTQEKKVWGRAHDACVWRAFHESLNQCVAGLS